MSIRPASNTSVTTKTVSQTGSLQIAPCVVPNPTSIFSILVYFLLLIKNLKLARQTGELEKERGKPRKSPFGQNFESYFELPNYYSNMIVVTDSDIVLTKCMCATAITADVRFKTALATDFKESIRTSSFDGNRGLV